MNPLETSDRSTNGRDTAEGDLRALKQLLLRDELETLDELKQEIHDSKLTTEQLAEMLPKAIHRSSQAGDRLSRSLGPTIATAFEQSVQRNRQALADAISPIIGPAIRRSIGQAIRGMIQSLNKTLEYSLSGKGMKWRWEALRTGKPFAEIVLLNVLKYRVEHVFLIHREDGLMLAESASEEGAADADLVSGMLTALRDLGRESLGAGQDETLDAVDFGDHTLWLESGDRATVAAIILGHPPKALRTLLREATDNIHLEFADAFEEFDGDTSKLKGTEEHLEQWKSAFGATEVYLEECLVSELHADDRKGTASSIWKWAWIVPLALLILGGFWLTQRAIQAGRQRQVESALLPPDTVDWQLQNDVVTLSGDAHHEWIKRAGPAVARLPFVKTVQRSELRDLDAPWLEALDQFSKIPGLVITQATRTGNRYRLEGLRDPLAPDPQSILAAAGVPKEQVDAVWTSFRSMEPDLLTQRFRQRLPACNSVSWKWDGSVLLAEGSASPEWLDLARRAASYVSDELSVDVSAVREIDNPQLRALHQAWLDALAKLGESPGIVVTRAEQTKQGYRLEGLRDPLADDPSEILQSFGLSSDEVSATWSPFKSIEPELVAKRLSQRLEECLTVSWTWEGGILVATGSAPHRWLRQLATYADQVRDELKVDFTQVADVDLEKRNELKTALEKIVIDHEPGQNTLVPGQNAKFEEVRRLIKLLRERCELMGSLPQIAILGYADRQTPSNQTMSTSIGRARTVWQSLAQLGLSDEHLLVKGMGRPSPQLQSRDARMASRLEVKFLGLAPP